MNAVKPKKILLIWIGRLGDLVISIPFIDSVRKKFPKSEITLLVRNYARPLAKLISAVDKVSIFPSIGLIFNKYDICVDMNPSYSRASGFLTVLSGARHRVSFDKYRANWFYNETVKKPDENEHMLLRYERLAEFLQAAYEPRPSISLSSKAYFQAEKILNGFKLKQNSFKVLVHPGNFKKYDNRWPSKKFIELSKKIETLSDVEQIYLTGPGEEEAVGRMLKQLPDTVKQIQPQSIEVSFAILKQIDILIVCGTGTMHMGWAMNTPMLCILNQYSYECWRPLNENTVSLTDGNWESCRNISVEKVWESFLKIYKEKNYENN